MAGRDGGGGGSRGIVALVVAAMWMLVVAPWIVATVLSPWSMTGVMWRAATDPPGSPRVIARWLQAAYGWNPVAALWFSPFTAPPVKPAGAPGARSAAVSKAGWGLTVRTRRMRYAVGQQVTIVVRLTNHTPASAPLPSGLSAPLDVTVLDPSGQPLPDVPAISWQPLASDTAWAACPAGVFDYCVAPGGEISRRVTFTPWSADYPDHEAGRWLVVTGIGSSRTEAAFEVTAPPAGGMPAIAPGR